MKTKFNYILIALCLMLFCFTGSANASEDFKINQFVKEGHIPIGIVINSGTATVHREALVFFIMDDFMERYEEFGGVTNFVGFNGSQIFLNKPSYAGYHCYYYKQYNEGDDWTLITSKEVWANSSATTIITDSHFKADNILYSSMDLKGSDGNIFFLKTPTVLTLEPVELGELAEKITGTMGEITIVAVSCLALLILLPLFWKVLFRFL